MVNVLIPTQSDDTHAIYTQLALNKKGHRAALWYTGDFPVQQTQSFELVNNNLEWMAEGKNFSIADDQFDIVWHRRPQKPTLADSIHPDDRSNAEKELIQFYQTWWHVIAPNANWINPASNAKRASSKLLQLQVAMQLGFNTPHTLISNNPAQIKQFISQYQHHETIYKTLCPMFWLKKNEVRLTYTKEISLDNLPSDDILQAVPGIFQKKVNKAYELRVTYFGDFAIAVKLKSQEHPKGIMDWRYVPTKELIIEPYNLPAAIHQRCLALMKQLGLVFGCFDFIVTPDNEYYFLEINEQGQFLWIEDANPDIKMLDIFSDFLINNSSHFSWRESRSSIALQDFRIEVESILQDARKNHINQ